ncbi:alkaline phosphatase [Geminocystis sp. NIES-3708]|nr:alkaline phosphatase [Geminocystis sp. NIES-3708]
MLPAGADIGTLFKDNEDDNTFQGSSVPDVYELTSDSANIIQGNLTQLNGDSLSQFHSDDVILVKNTQFTSQQLTFNENTLQIDVNNDGETDANIILEGDYSNGSLIVKQLLNDTIIAFNTSPTAVFLANAITELNNNILVRDGIQLAEIVIEDDDLGVNEISLTGKDKERFEVRDNALFLIGANPNSEIQDEYEVTLNVYDPTIDNQPDVTTNYTLKIVNASDNVDALLNSPFYRFQNSDFHGIYIWAGDKERQTINQNYPNFKEEGVAFKVAIEPNDNLIQFNRFQNELGAYLYVGEAESQNIRENYPNFKEEGIAFYALDGNANRGIDIYRLQNTQQPGTYIFVGEEEKNNILANSPQFQLEGVAFEAIV